VLLGCETPTAYSITNLEIFPRRITKPSTQAKLYDSKIKLTSSLQITKLKICQVITKRSSRRWLKYCKTQVSYLIPIKALDGFYIDHGDSTLDEESIDRLWLVVRSLKNPEGKFDYKIKKFDTIKLGRVRFRVKDFRCEQMSMTPKELFAQELKEAQTVKTAADFS